MTRDSAILSLPRESRRESNISISANPHGEQSSSSSDEDDSIDAFDRRGHQGSYVLRKVYTLIMPGIQWNL